MSVYVDRAFITFPAISVASGGVDRFKINACVDHIIGVTGTDADTEEKTGARSVVMFGEDSGMHAVLSEAEPEDIASLLDNLFVEIPVVSAVDGKVKLFIGYIDAYKIVAVNDLDRESPQIAEEALSIVYFRPKSGIRPMLSTVPAREIVARTNEMIG